MSVIFGLEASFCAEGEEVLRVRARISKGAEEAMRASTTAPPCFPVAPMMRILRRDMVVTGRVVWFKVGEWCGRDLELMPPAGAV